MNDVRSKSVKGSIWSLIDNFCTHGLTFLIGIVLARLLTPSDYGTVGVLAIFIAIANVFVDCGFSKAIIRKKERTQADLSTAFYFNIGIGIIVYLLLFFLSPAIALFFKMPILKVLLRVLALCIVFNALSLVHNSILTAQLDIRKQTLINLCAQIPIGFISIYVAYIGLGVWTLVIQTVGSSFLKTLFLWIASKWRPIITFSKSSFKYLYNFGWKLLGASLMGTFFNEFYGFVIGRFLGSSHLGIYSKSKSLADGPKFIVTNVIDRVVLPIMVETQGDKNRIKDIYQRMIKLLSFMVFPVFGLFIVIAHPLIIILWTQKWSDTIFIFQLFCIGSAFGPLSSLNFSLLQLLNRTDLTLKLEFIKKPICLALLFAGIPFGLKGIVLFASVYNIIATVINMYPTKKLLGYSLCSQIKDLLLYVVITAAACFVTIGICYFISTLWVKLIAELLIFSVVYMIINSIIRTSAIIEFKSLLWKRKK